MTLRTSLALLAVILLAGSCTSGSEGIFASIEREEKIVSLGGLSETATVTSMTEFNGKYYATGGKALFNRSTDVNAKKWNKTTVGGESEVAAVGTAGTKLFAVASGKLFSSTDGSHWARLTLGTADAAFDLIPVRKGDGVSSQGLVVVTTTGRAYQRVIVIDNNGDLGSPVSLASEDLVEPVHSAVANGVELYLASRTSVTKVTGGTPSAVVDNASLGHDIGGLIFLDATVGNGTHAGFYLTTLSNAGTGGGIYKAATSSPATFSAVKTNIKVSTYPVAFGGLLYNKENGTLWLATGATTGAEGSGYLEYDLAKDSLATTPNTNANNYTSSYLPSSAVGTLFRSASGVCFLGTVAHGLWVWDSSARTWSQQ